MSGGGDEDNSGISSEPMSVPVTNFQRGYRSYVEQQCRCLTMKCSKQGECKLWRQMVLGFITTACIGLVLLFLGSVFIADAVAEQNSIATMLCVIGIVGGAIIIMGTIILGKMCKLCIISKQRNEDEAPFPQQQQGACFNTCSVVYTRSTDHIPTAIVGEPPPSYDSVVGEQNPHSTAVHSQNNDDQSQPTVVMVLPPKYDDISAPLPPYKDNLDSNSE